MRYRKKKMVQTVALPSEASTPLKWLRGIGAGSILIGSLGLMQAFYLPSVVCLYFGLLIVFIDLLFEKFKIRFVFALVVLGLAALFTWRVVLHDSPIIASYLVTHGTLRVRITNASDEDYRDLDLKIEPDYPDDFVFNPQEASNIGGLTVLHPPYQATGEPNDRFTAQMDPTQPGTPHDWASNFLRFQCDKLTRHTTAEFTMNLEKSIVAPDKQSSSLQQTSTVKQVTIEGTYKGPFREYKISQPALNAFLSSYSTAPFNKMEK